MIEIFCAGCGATGAVGRVTAGLQCRCGSTDLGLVGSDEMPEHVAKKPKKGENPFPPKGKKKGEDDDAEDVKSETGSSGPKARKGDKPWDIDPKAKKQKESAAANPYPTRGSGGSGWGQHMPDTLQGWNDYAGPPPPGDAPFNPGNRDSSNNTTTCPICHGTGYDVQDKTVCRECGGFGVIHHPSEPEGPPPVARHPGQTVTPQVGPVTSTYLPPMSSTAPRQLVVAGRPSQQAMPTPEYYLQHHAPDYRYRNTTVQEPFDENAQASYAQGFPNQSPAVKSREQPAHNYSHGDRPLQLDQAWCPMCGHDPTQVVKDKHDNAWWHCPNCGPLANIDKNPGINPYDTEDDFLPDRNMKTATIFTRKAKLAKTGRIFSIVASILAVNQVTDREAFELARRTVAAYPEQV